MASIFVSLEHEGGCFRLSGGVGAWISFCYYFFFFLFFQSSIIAAMGLIFIEGKKGSNDGECNNVGSWWKLLEGKKKWWKLVMKG